MLASITPRKIAINDFFLFNPSSTASPEPVQAPVPGNGMPTNNKRPRYPYFSICSLLESNLFSNLSTKLPVILNFLKKLNIFSKNKSTIGIGRTLPTILIR